MNSSPERSSRAGFRPRDRRAIRVGLLVLLPALVLAMGVRPYLGELDETRHRLAAERGLLVREHGLLAAAKGFDADRVSAREALDARASRLFAGDPTLAAGALVRYVADQADRSRVLLEATETAGTEAVGSGLSAVRIRLSGVSDIAGILELLRRLEDGPRLVRIEQLLLERRDGYAVRGLDRTYEDVQLVSIGATIVAYTWVAEGDGG